MKINFFLIALLIFFMTRCTMERNREQLSDEINSDCKEIVEQTTNKPQSEIISNYNKIDNNGKKQGLWIEENGNTRIERYYKGGVRSGVYKQFLAGKLVILGEYTNDKESGIWYYYDKEHLTMTFENYATNYDTITSEGGKGRYIPDYKCYYKAYYPNGTIKEEGWLLWSEGDSPESDLSVEYGTWKYYNEDGKLTQTKEYKP
ncbi:MAG: hypothetical protein PHT14_10795 [Petrimonas sp.]|nr:hypothetical protein [Petrimonas sp.]